MVVNYQLKVALTSRRTCRTAASPDFAMKSVKQDGFGGIFHSAIKDLVINGRFLGESFFFCFCKLLFQRIACETVFKNNSVFLNEMFESISLFTTKSRYKSLRPTTPNLTASRPRQPPLTILTFSMLMSV